MPAAPNVIMQDLESLLRRAQSRAKTGAWNAAADALTRASDLAEHAATLPSLRESPHLAACEYHLADLRARLTRDLEANRAELDQIRYARARLRPTRNAYRRPSRSSRKLELQA